MNVVNELLEMLAPIATIFGVVVVYLEILRYRARQLENRFNYLSKLYGEYLKDEIMVKIFNDIEWSNQDLGNKIYNEYHLDCERFFAVFENYLFVRETQLKGDTKGFEIYEYMLDRIVNNNHIIAYFSTTLSSVVKNVHPYPRLNSMIMQNI